MTPPAATRGPTRRVLRALGRTVGVFALLLAFLVALLAGAVLHVGLPVSRGAAARIVERFLDATFQGSFEIGAIERLGGGGLRASSLSAYDPDGRLVLSIEQLEADVDPIDLVRRLLSDDEKLSIVIERVYLQGSEIQFLPTNERDAKGNPETHISLADAFTPVPSQETKASTEPGRPVRVWFPKIVLRDAYAHGTIAGSPVLEAQARLAIATLLATDQGVAVDVERFGLQASGFSGVDTSARGEVHVRVPGAIWGDVSGSLGNIPVRHQFRFEGDELDVRGDYPSLEPSDLRPLLGTWPLDRSLAAQARIFGPMDSLEVEATVTPLEHAGATQPGKIHASGSIELAPHNHATLRITTHRLDVSELLSTLPVSELDSESKLRVDWSGKTPTLELETRVEPGRVGGMNTPATQATGHLSSEGWGLDAELLGPEIAGTVEAHRQGDSALEFQARMYPTSISQSVLLSQSLSPATGTLEGTAKGKLDNDSLELALDLKGSFLRVGGVRVDAARLNTNLSGPLDTPLLWKGSSRLSTQRVSYGSLQFSRVDVVQSGQLARPRLAAQGQTQAGVSLSVSADVDVVQKAVFDLKAELSGSEQPIELLVNKIRFGAGEVEIRAFSMQSIGKIEGDLLLKEKGSKAEIRARNLSVSRISRALGLARGEVEGELDADVNLSLGDYPRGFVSLNVHDAAALGFRNLAVSARSDLDGSDLTGKIHAEVGGVGAFESSWDARLDGPATQGESYSRAEGHFSLATQDLDLKTLSVLLGNPGGLDASGRASVSLDVSRKQGRAPRGNLSLSTKDLELTHAESDFKMRGVDVELVAAIPESADGLETALRIVDPFGSLISLSGTLALPLQRWSQMPPTREQALFHLRNAEVNLVALFPNRKVSRLPLFVPRPVEEGEISMRAAVSGPWNEPDVSLVLTGRNWFGSPLPATEPLTFHTNLRYRATKQNLLGSVTIERDENRVASVQLDLELNQPALLEYFGQGARAAALPQSSPKSASAPPHAPLWQGHVQAFLESTPLTLVNTFKEWGLRGRAQGSLRVDRTEMLPRISGELALRDMEFRQNDLGDAHLELETVANDLVARLDLQDDSGTLSIAAESGILATPLFATANEKKPPRATLRAERYDSGVLLPLLSGIFDEFSGPLFGTAAAEIRPTGDPAAPFSLSLSGDLKLEGGLITPSALGTRLKDVHARIDAETRSPYTMIRLRTLRAKADSAAENLEGRAEIRLKNFALHDGSFELHPDKMPLSTGGTKLADVTGAVLGRLAMVDKELRVEIVTDDLLAELPETGDTELIDLSDNPTIKIVQRQVGIEEAPPEAPRTPVMLKLRLGQNVRVKNSLLDVRIRGTPEMRIVDTVAIGGAIELARGGRFVVLGRTFMVERGLVLFDTGDASDPHLQAIASWKAPNGVVVTVTVGGTVRAPTLDWSSEPALPGGEQDIIALVLGAGGGGGETSTGVANTSLAIAANEISDVEGLEFYTTSHAQGGEGRVASLSDSNWDSYTAAYQISDQLWFEGSFQQGTVGLNQEQHSGVSGTLDWRFHPQWSARTEVGTLGAGLDLLWQYRY